MTAAPADSSPTQSTIPVESGGAFSIAAVKSASRWLSAFAQNVHSQAGEDGILAKALSLLPDRDGWCIEFGAWDGQHLSNTCNLVGAQGYRVVLIEADRHKYSQLCSDYPYRDRAIFIHALVGWSSVDNLDRLLRPHAVPANPDLLSVDVDGNDYHIWRAMKSTRPKLVLVEYNPTMANSLEFVQKPDPACHHGNSPASLVKLGKEKGYELIAATRLNLLFVDRQYYSLFNLADNALEAMRDDPPDHIFCGYDGTVFVQGAVGARWHRLWLAAGDLQVLPVALRRYPPTYTRFQRFALACFLFFRNPIVELKRIGRPHSESNQMAVQRRRGETRTR